MVGIKSVKIRGKGLKFGHIIIIIISLESVSM